MTADMTTDKHRLFIHALPPGTIIEGAGHRYTVVRTLGAGGFGITYLVTVSDADRAGRGRLVVKEHFLKGCWRGDDGMEVKHAPTVEDEVSASRRDFMEEARRLGILGNDSPNIVKVHDTFEANATAYYSMEYLDGGDLQSFVSTRGPLTEDKAVETILVIAKAVGMLHASHILHLDIKPSNVVLKTDVVTGSKTPVLIDFGIAKHFRHNGRPTSRLIAKGASSGYAPIEQYDDIETFSPAIDVYALGATLYFMLTGKNPPKAFDIESFDDLRANLPDGTNERTIRAIECAMKRIKHERTPTVDAFMTHLCGRTVSSNATEVFLGHRKDRKRRAILPAVLAGAAAIAVTVIVLLSKPALSGGHQGPAATPEAAIADKAIVEPAETPSRESKETPGETTTPKTTPEETAPDLTVDTEAASRPSQTTADKPQSDRAKMERAYSTRDEKALTELLSEGFAEALIPLARIEIEKENYAAAEDYAVRAFMSGLRDEARVIHAAVMLSGHFDDENNVIPPQFQ